MFPIGDEKSMNLARPRQEIAGSGYLARPGVLFILGSQLCRMKEMCNSYSHSVM
jgi:hypothetical protein